MAYECHKNLSLQMRFLEQNIKVTNITLEFLSSFMNMSKDLETERVFTNVTLHIFEKIIFAL